jgi:protein SCO1/2
MMNFKKKISTIYRTKEIRKVFALSAFTLCLTTFVFSLQSCTETNRELPYLGQHDEIDGKKIYHQIPEFTFTNQDSITVTQDDFKDKVYVADFFFTSCPTICPVMKTQMLRVYKKFRNNPGIGILSHTIDPRHDSVNVLHDYRERLGVSGNTWQFVTGKQDDIYNIGEKFYMVTAQEDSTAVAEGGFLHSGAFVLVDKNRHIRGVYDGTVEDEVSQLMKDIELLLSKEN